MMNSCPVTPDVTETVENLIKLFEENKGDILDTDFSGILIHYDDIRKWAQEIKTPAEAAAFLLYILTDNASDKPDRDFEPIARTLCTTLLCYNKHFEAKQARHLLSGVILFIATFALEEKRNFSPMFLVDSVIQKEKGALLNDLKKAGKLTVNSHLTLTSPLLTTAQNLLVRAINKQTEGCPAAGAKEIVVTRRTPKRRLCDHAM